MVVSPRSAHAAWIDMVGHDVAVVGELTLADAAFPVLSDHLFVQQLPHLAVGADLAVSARMLWILDSSDAKLSGSSLLRGQFPSTA